MPDSDRPACFPRAAQSGVFRCRGTKAHAELPQFVAAKDVNLSVPLVVRLEGTNVDEGKAILNGSGLAIVSADDLGDAARKIVAEVKKAA